MENYKILMTMELSKLQEIFHQVYVGINKIVDQMGDTDDKIIVSVPKYFVDILRNRRFFEYRTTALFLDEKRPTFFGRPIQWNFDNYIVVFHEDMPLRSD